MAVKGSSQITLIDLTDGYSVILTNDSYTFLGDTDSVASTQSTTCQVQALCGAEQVPCSVGEMDLPNGLSIVSNGQTPIPTLTITATTALKTSGTVMIPVKIGDITISKAFSYSIAFRGANGADGDSVTITETSVTYQVGTSGTTAPSGPWLTTIPTVPQGKYLWTKTEVTYSDGTKTEAYSVSRAASDGSDGTSVTVTSTKTEYNVHTSGTSIPNDTWNPTIPTVPQGQFLWTRVTVTYSDGKSAVSYSVSRSALDGSDGADAISMVIESSAGTVFKNTDIATTLTAHVYKGAVEVTGASLTALGTIKWYKDGASTSMATGTTLTIQAGDVLNKATYTAKLEG